MDKTRNRTRAKGYYYLLSGLLLSAVLGGYFYGRPPGVRVAQNTLTVKTVTDDEFFEYINLTARVEPGESYFLDSRVAGNIETIFVESGQQVLKGDTLLFISNADLELEVMQREGALIEQLNAQRQTRLLLDQNDFARREALIATDYQLSLRTKQFQRATGLLADSLIALSNFEPTENDYAYLQRRQELLRAAYRQDSIVRQLQLNQLAASEKRLLANLDRVRAILDRRYVLAPAAGRLADFNVRAGQAITTGERLGEVYTLTAPVLVAEADEFYLSRIYPGQQGQLLGGDDSLQLEVIKVYPSVEGGRFRVDLAFRNASGDHGGAAGARAWTKGQSRRVRLYFGEPMPSVLLATGNFYAATGGHWVYRLRPDGRAEKTSVRLGRANPDYHEVLEGLQPGDRVITSAYDDFKSYETLIIN